MSPEPIGESAAWSTEGRVFENAVYQKSDAISSKSETFWDTRNL